MKELTNQICIKKNNLRAAVDKEEYEKAAEIKMMIEGMQKSLLTLLPSISQSTLNVSSLFCTSLCSTFIILFIYHRGRGGILFFYMYNISPRG